MQPKKLTGGQELLCINTLKVYDWILNEASFNVSEEDIDLPTDVTCSILADVTCEVRPADEEEDGVPPFVVLGRETRTFIINGEEVELQLVNIRKNFVVDLFAVTTTGLTVPFADTLGPFSRCEQVILCAPEGTTVDVAITEADCFVCNFICDETTDPDTIDVDITVRLCQSIQSTFPVTLEIEAEFCEPRGLLPFPPCPTPVRPNQCPVLFPNNG